MADNPINGQRHERSALFVYGTETGNSQDVAEELERTAQRLRFATRVSEMDLVQINELLQYSLVVFVISTTGQGEFPRNATKLWKSLLRKRLPPNCLGHVSFTTFGLGDSSYPKYNWTVRKLHKRLEQLGAKEFFPRGEADEQHEEGIDGTFLSWSAEFQKHLLSSFPLPEGSDPIPAQEPLPAKFQLELAQEISSETIKTNSLVRANNIDANSPTESAPASIEKRAPEAQVEADHNNNKLPNNTNNEIHAEMESQMRLPQIVIDEKPEPSAPCEQLKEDHDGKPDIDTHVPPAALFPVPDGYEAMIIKNKRVTPESHWQDVRELTLIVTEEVCYQPGDVVTIYPKNFPGDVERLIELQGWTDIADLKLTFKPGMPDFFAAKNLVRKPPGLHSVAHPTLRELLTNNLDITAIPKRYFFQLIAGYTNDQMHKDRLFEFSDALFRDEYFDYATRPRRSILEVLLDFPSVKIPWRDTLALFPVIRGRQYSISSGGALSVTPESGMIKVQLLIAMVKYRTVLRKIRHGLCSRYIDSLEAHDTINITFETKPSFYRIASAYPENPLIMIAPGTGLAPCRSLIWQRAKYFSQNLEDDVGECYLFYGGRNKNADFFYRDEWAYATNRTKVFTAFSRDQKEKIYVQHVIREQGELLAELMKKVVVIYVCGSSGQMPKAVREAILDVMQKHGVVEGGRDGAVKRLEFMEKTGHYVQETW